MIHQVSQHTVSHEINLKKKKKKTEKSESGLFIGFLVEKCIACQSQKSEFGWHQFCF